jgi:H+-translocating NAD(P) transhydrogenase subunit alpha
MTIGILKEPEFETRVSMIPETVGQLVKKGVAVVVESGAGIRSSNTDEAYVSAGATIGQRQTIYQSDILLSINNPGEEAIGALKGKTLIGVFSPLYNPSAFLQWAQNGVNSFSLDMLPRTTRAQSMDVLSSQANIAGYKAVLLAAHTYPRYFPMFMTAAGSIPPAKVLILGAGVAGLQAIATARRLGAVVEVFDTRPAVKEEVMSLGGRFIEVEGAADASSAGGYAVEQSADFLERQKQKIASSLAKADIVITTAQIPGKKAPLLVSTEMVQGMRNGSMIIDLAAATGGNTELTRNNETVQHNGVTIVGNSFLAASMPYDASKLYGKNVFNFLSLLISKENALTIDSNDDLVKGACITYNGELVNERMKPLLTAEAAT